VGRDGIFVDVAGGIAEAASYAPWFSRVEPLAAFPIVRAGFPVETVHFFRCVRQTDPYLFGYAGPGPVPKPMSRTARSKGGSVPASTTQPANGIVR
jgi:hypothetical protein